MKKLILGLFVAAVVLAPFQQANAGTFLELVTPNGGEKYTAGQTINIKWKTTIPKDGQIGASLLKLKGTEWSTDGDYYNYVETTYPIYLDNYLNTGSSAWPIPYNQPEGYYVVELSAYYSQQFDNISGTDHSSKPFRIMTGKVSSAAPVITGITPNPVFTGQEVILTGSNFKSSNKVFMRMLGNDMYGNMEIYNAKTVGRNTITFTIDQQITAGKYEVFVENTAGSSKPSSLIVAESPITPFPSIENITPQRGGPGTTITLTGKNFTAENDINYYTSFYGPWPIAEDQPAAKDEMAVGGTSEYGSAGDDSSSSDDKYIMPPYPNTSGTITGVKSSNGSTLQFQLPEDVTTPGIYTISVYNEKGYSGEAYFTLLDTSSTAAHPAGTNVRGPDGTIYFIDAGNTRMPYTSAAVFNSYKFNRWEDVLPANQADMELPLAKYIPLGSSQETTYFVPPRSGSLFKDKGTVYLINYDQRTPFASAKTFTSAGYSFANVVDGNTSYMVTLVPYTSADQAHPEGTLVNENGVIYVMKGGYKMGFPNMATFTSWGYSVNDIVPANSSDAKIQVSGVVSNRNPGQLNL